MAVALRELDRGGRRPQLRVVPTAPPPAPRHVYWLRRTLVALVTVGLVIAGAGAVRALRSASAEPVARTNLTVVVQPGQTLWDIAARYVPADQNLPDWVAEVAEVNGVDGQALQPGMPIVVPLEGAVVTATLQEGADQ